MCSELESNNNRYSLSCGGPGVHTPVTATERLFSPFSPCATDIFSSFCSYYHAHPPSSRRPCHRTDPTQKTSARYRLHPTRTRRWQHNQHARAGRQRCTPASFVHRVNYLLRQLLQVQAPAMSVPTDAQFFSRQDPTKPDVAFLKNHFYREGRVTEDQAMWILEKATALLRAEPNVLQVDAPITGEL